MATVQVMVTSASVQCCPGGDCQSDGVAGRWVQAIGAVRLMAGTSDSASHSKDTVGAGHSGSKMQGRRVGGDCASDGDVSVRAVLPWQRL